MLRQCQALVETQVGIDWKKFGEAANQAVNLCQRPVSAGTGDLHPELGLATPLTQSLKKGAEVEHLQGGLGVLGLFTQGRTQVRAQVRVTGLGQTPLLALGRHRTQCGIAFSQFK